MSRRIDPATLVLHLLGILACLPAAEAPLVLAAGGTSEYSILCAVDASPAAREGARELGDCLRLVAGVALPVLDQPRAGVRKLIVGARPAADRAVLPPDGFAVDAVGGDLYLYGSDSPQGDLLAWSAHRASIQAGSYFAVVEFARRWLGVEWYMPGPQGMAWLPRERIEVPGGLRMRGSPRFPRRVIEGAARAPGIDRRWQARVAAGEWPASVLLSTDGECARWGRRMLLGNLVLDDFQHAHHLFIPADKPNRPERAPRTYGADHPDYFALVAGRRTIAYDSPHHHGGQLCLSNPAVAATYAANAAAWLTRVGVTQSVSLSPNDGGGHCTCEACQAWDDIDPATGKRIPSTRLLRFANRVAEQVAAAIPDARLGLYAYDTTRRPPIAAVELHPAIRVSDVYNYLPNYWHSGERERARIRSDLAAWRRLARHVTLTSYYDIYGNWSLPWDTSDAMGEVMRLLAEHASSDGVVMNNCRYAGLAPGADGARLWVLARLLWNPDQDPGMLQRQFYRGAFGEIPGARLAEYYACINRSWIAALARWPLSGDHEGEDTRRQCVYPLQVYGPIRVECRRLVDDALAAAASLDEGVRWRVDQVARCWRFAEATLDAAMAAEAAHRLPAGATQPEREALWRTAAEAGMRRRSLLADPANRFAISAPSVEECDRMRPLGIVERMPDSLAVGITAAWRPGTPITIDGRPDETVWAGIAPSRRFLDNRRGGEARVGTWVQALNAGDDLVLAFRCAEPEMGSLRSIAGNLWAGDVIEFFCSPTGAEMDYSHFTVNPDGAADAYRLRGDTGKDGAWSPGWTWAAARGTGEWTAELRIPWRTLEVAPASGDKPLVGFFRERSAGDGGLMAWIPTGGRFAQPMRFGRLAIEFR